MTTPDTAGLCERLRAALEGVTPGDLDTSDHIGSGNYNCPCCEGEGAVEGKTFTNFDGFAIGVQFFGVGDEFAKYEAFFRAANPQTVRALLDTLERQAAEIKRLREALRNIQIEAEREEGRWVHLKRVIAVNARAALTGEDAAGSSTNQNTEPGLAFSAPVELSGNPGEPKPLMTAQELADHAADAFDNALPDDALPHEVGRAWKAVGERLAAILAERAEE